MLDKYVNAVMNKVSGVIAAVGAQRDEWERQRGNDRYAQSYLGTALKHPEGHTSPLRKSAERAQQEYASLRAEWQEAGPQMLTLAAALMIARERRDETKALWERHDAEEQKRLATKYHPEVRRLFAQFFDHGVKPAMLDLLRPETIGIMADLILWDASDRDGTDGNSPLPQVFGIYAGRTMVMPGGGHTVTRSLPGIAPASVKHSDPDYYRFDVLAASNALAAGGQPEGEVAAEKAASESRADEHNDLDEPVPPTDEKVQHTAGQGVSEVASMITEAATITHHGQVAERMIDDEFALPAHIPPEDAEALMAGAKRWVAMDDEWRFELRGAMGWTDNPGPEAIELVQAARQPEAATPFRYFIDAAIRDGIDAGQTAYEMATIRRFAFEFATRDEWKQIRTNLGLNW
jgi:hypothetical protein